MGKQYGFSSGNGNPIERKGVACRSASAAMRSFGQSIDCGLRSVRNVWDLRHELRKVSGQGTTEYAILVGVLVVIAILAITVFRPKIQELWDAISSGINGL